MNVAKSMKRLWSQPSSSQNGHDAPGGAPARPLAFVPVRGPRQTLLLIAPLALVGIAAYAMQQRRSDGTARPGTAGAARTKARRRPRSLVRYYGLGVVIAALERDSTRKAVIGVLKLAQKRA